MSELRFVPHVHQAGDSVALPYPIVNALAWWVTAELIRRHPNTLRVLETHPGGGQYDCLSLFRRDGDHHNPELVVHLNRSGSITPNSWFHSDGGGEPDRFNWLDVLAADDRRTHIVEQLEGSEGLGSPKSTPPTNRRSVGPRVLARFAASASLTTRRWDIRNGYLDTSGEEGGVNEFVDLFPGITLDPLPSDPGGEPSYRYWFVLDHEGTPFTVIDVDRGLAWRRDRDGEQFDLMDIYKSSGGRIDAVARAVMPDVE